MKPERVSEISLEFQPSNTITRFSFYFSSFFPPPRLNIISLFKKLVKQVFKIAWKLSSRQREAPNNPSPPFKEKEKGGEGGSEAWWPMEGSKLDGHWKVPSLVAIGMFKLGGQRKVPSLVAIGRWRKNAFSPLPFSPNNLNLHLHFFPSTLRFYFTMVLSRYSRWRAPKSRGETHLRVSQSQVAESWDLVAHSRLPTLKRGRGSSWEPRD